MTSGGIIGELVKVRRRGTKSLVVEWQISHILSLLDGKQNEYESPEFIFGNNRCKLRLWPNWKVKRDCPKSGFVRLHLWKYAGPPETFLFIAFEKGIKNRTKIKWSRHPRDICKRSVLMNISSSLVPISTLRIMCIIRRVGSIGKGLSTDVEVNKNNGDKEKNGNDEEKDYKDYKALKIVQQQNQLKKTEKRSSYGTVSGDEDACNDHKNDEDDYKYDEARNSENVRQQKRAKKSKAGEDVDHRKYYDESDFKSDDKGTKKIESCVRQQDVMKNAKKRLESLVRDLGKLISGGENSDVSVQVGDTEFKLHRNILSARSPVLSAMLKHKATNNTISIRDCEPDVFGEYLQYLYTGSVQLLSPRNVFHLYRVASNYLADELKEQCLMYIQEGLSVQTFCDAVKLALVYGESGLLAQAIGFASENIRLIVCTREWQDFNREYPSEANEVLIKVLGPPDVCPELSKDVT